MRFLNVFRPRHLHPDATVRLRSVDRLRNQTVLAKMAEYDPDGRVRIEAGRRIADPLILERIILSERDREVRLAVIGSVTNADAITRLLGSSELETASVEALVRQLQDQEMLAKLADSSPDARVRVEASRRLKDSSSLERIVRVDADREVRLAAAHTLRNVHAISRLIDDSHLDEEVVGAFDADAFSAAVKQLSMTRPLREIAVHSPHERVRIEAARFRDELSTELQNILSEGKRRDDYSWDERVTKLLDKGGDPNVRDASGRPAVCLVAQHGYPRTLQHMLALGADLNARTSDGDTPLRIAAGRGQDAMVEVLLADQRLSREVALESLNAAFQGGHVEAMIRLLMFLDTLQSARFKYISAVQAEGTFAIVVKRGGYCSSILDAVESFIRDALGWTLLPRGGIRRRWDHHVQDVTYVQTLVDGKPNHVRGIGYLLRNSYSSDYGMGTESSSAGGGVLTVHLLDQTVAEGAARLLALTRAIDQKTR